jgi:hypothetical protein
MVSGNIGYGQVFSPDPAEIVRCRIVLHGPNKTLLDGLRLSRDWSGGYI